MTTSGIHVRDHKSVLAAAERRTLVWIAGRLPRVVHSDHLSALGFISMLLVAASFAAFRVSNVAAVGVVVFLATNWFGDSLDGTVARVRGEERPKYGYYLDHVLDLAGTAALMAGLACSGLMQPLVAASLLGAYLLVAADRFLATHAVGVFRMSEFGFGPTELRLLLAAGALAAMNSPEVTWHSLGTFRLFDVGGVIAIVGLTGAFLISGVQNVRVLYRAEPLSRAADRSGAHFVG